MKMNAKIFLFSVDKVLHTKSLNTSPKTSGAGKHFTNVSESKSVVLQYNTSKHIKKEDKSGKQSSTHNTQT